MSVSLCIATPSDAARIHPALPTKMICLTVCMTDETRCSQAVHSRPPSFVRNTVRVLTKDGEAAPLPDLSWRWVIHAIHPLCVVWKKNSETD